MNNKITSNLITYFFFIVLINIIFLHPLNAKTTIYELSENSSKIQFMVKHKITKDVYGEFLNLWNFKPGNAPKILMKIS